MAERASSALIARLLSSSAPRGCAPAVLPAAVTLVCGLAGRQPPRRNCVLGSVLRLAYALVDVLEAAAGGTAAGSGIFLGYLGFSFVGECFIGACTGGLRGGVRLLS